MSNTTLSDGAISWLRLAIESQHIDNGTTTNVASCGCCVSLEHIPEKRRILRIMRCTVAYSDGYKHASDILRALVVATQLCAVKDVLDLLTAAFAWHFVRSNTVHCTNEVDSYLRGNPKAVLAISDLTHADTLAFSSTVHSDLLACLALKSVNATRRLYEKHIALDRHVCIWPVCDVLDGLPETAQKNFDAAIVVLRNRAQRIGHVFTTGTHYHQPPPPLPDVTNSKDTLFDFNGIVIWGDAVTREIGVSLYSTHKYQLCCASLPIAKRLYDLGLKSAEQPANKQQQQQTKTVVAVSEDEKDVIPRASLCVQNFFIGLKTEGSACHYSIKVNGNTISIYAPTYSVQSDVFQAILETKSKKAKANSPAKPIEFSDATIVTRQEQQQDARVWPNSELDCLYFSPNTFTRFAYSPKDDKAYATLQSLIGLF
jgi:hypothetical protein